MKNLIILVVGIVIGGGIARSHAFQSSPYALDIAPGFSIVNIGKDREYWWVVTRNKNRWHLHTLPYNSGPYELFEEER